MPQAGAHLGELGLPERVEIGEATFQLDFVP